jgi:hypothetical protein
MKKIYVSSKLKFIPMWKEVRKNFNVISTWIDIPEGEEDLEQIAICCIEEPRDCDILLLYVEPNDYLKYALMEFGSALCANNTVYIVLNNIDLSKNQKDFTKEDLKDFSSISPAMLNHPNVTLFNSLEEALKRI